MKICGRCDQSIADGEAYTEHLIDRPTGPGLTVYQHDGPCPQEEAAQGHGRIRR